MSGINQWVSAILRMVYYHLCPTAGCHPRGGKTVIPASRLNDGKMTWLRETPYSLHYYPTMETLMGIQGNDLGHSNNVKDWAIRRRVPKPVLIGYGTVSETAKASVTYEGLISQRLLKVQSTRWRKSVEQYAMGWPCVQQLSAHALFCIVSSVQNYFTQKSPIFVLLWEKNEIDLVDY
jgi:hypothetical protein